MNKRLYALPAVLAALLLLTVVTSANAVSLPGGEALFETSLQDRITSSDTTMTLVSNSLRGGQSISGYHCFTIDEGRSDQEFVCGTVSGTTVSGLERGLSLVSGTTTISSLRVAHRKGANVKIGDFPLIQRVRNILSGTEGLPSPIGYASHPDFSGALGTTIPDITYVAGLIGGGVGVPLPVNIGGTGAVNFPSMLLQGNGTDPISATSTPTVSTITATSTATSTFAGPITNTYSGISTSTFSGNLQIQGNASTTGNTVFNGPLTATATTTISASPSAPMFLNGVKIVFPSSQGTVGTTYVNDGNGNLTYGKPAVGQYSLASTSASTIGQNATLTSRTLTVPAGVLTASSTLQMAGSFSCIGGGSGGTCHFKLIDTAGVTYFDQTFSQTGSNTCNLIYTIQMTALTISTQAGVISGGGLCNGTHSDQTTGFTSSGNWANTVELQVQMTTTNTTNLQAVQKGFVITVTP